MPEVFFDRRDSHEPIPPDAEEIVRLMRDRGEDFWNDPDGPGFATLSFHADGREGDCTSQLVFTKNDRHGFHFWLSHPVSDLDSPYYRELTSYFSCSDPELREWISVRDSHEGQRSIFTGLFVPVEMAVEVVREFVRSGERSDRVQWITGQVIQAAKRRCGLA